MNPLFRVTLMKPLKQPCVPRKGVFDVSRRDTALDLSNLISDTIDSDAFLGKIISGQVSGWEGGWEI